MTATVLPLIPPALAGSIRETLSRRELVRLERLVRRWQRLAAAAQKGYALAERTRDVRWAERAEMVDAAADVALFDLEHFIAELESESEAHAGAEVDLEGQLATLYDEWINPRAFGGRRFEDEADFAGVIRHVLADFGTLRGDPSTRQLIAAAKDAWTSVRRRRRLLRDVGVVSGRARALRALRAHIQSFRFRTARVA